MSDLYQNIKNMAKEGVIFGARLDTLITAIAIVVPEGREFIRNHTLTYLGYMAGIEAASIFGGVSFDLSARYGGEVIDRTVTRFRNLYSYIHNR